MKTPDGWTALVAMAAAGLLAGCSTMRPPGAPERGRPPLSAGGQVWLRTAIGSGRADLRWPDFGDYSQHVKKFYDLTGNSLGWVRDSAPTPQARQVIALLLQAGNKGLSADDYDGSRWSQRMASLKPATGHPAEADALRFDLALTVCVMRYISDLHTGKVNPKRLAFAFDEEARKYDLAEFLKDRLVDSGDAAGALAPVEPPYPGYRRTLQALRRYAEFAATDDGEPLPPLKQPLVSGDDYPGIPRLARLLRLLGDLPRDANVPADGTTYTAALVDAVRNFQRRHGRNPNGKLGTATLADLNVPLSRRVKQMQLALERWRWLPDTYRQSPIIANIPEFRLRAYDKDFNVAVTMNVVVGNSFGHSTPVFADTMTYLVFRPYWEVPPSIIRAELVPHVLHDRDYLTKKGFELVNSRQKVMDGGATARGIVRQLRAGTLFVRQKSGPKNSLGLVKFVFPNTYDIYMHDTPAAGAFASTRRDFSHGCIRLERPAELAAWVLRDNPGWNAERIRAAMNGDAPQQVNLVHPIPVLIVYLTVVVLEDGVVHFFDDIYRHDAALEEALAKGYPYPG